MPSEVFVLNRINLGTLGQRRPEVYGTSTLSDLENLLGEMFSGVDFEFRQTDHEEGMVGFIREAAGYAGIANNPGVWTHYSYSLRDA